MKVESGDTKITSLKTNSFDTRTYTMFTSFSCKDDATIYIANLALNLQVEHEKIVTEIAKNNIFPLSYDCLTKEIVRHATHQKLSHPDYGTLASRAYICNIYRLVPGNFSAAVHELYCQSIIRKDFYQFVLENKNELDSWAPEERQLQQDNEFSVDALNTMYAVHALRKKNNEPGERPQHVWLRCVVDASGYDLVLAKKMYHVLSARKAMLATPIIANAGLPIRQFASCFLVEIKDDSAEGIYDSLKDCALLSKSGGGIALHVNRIRATGSLIHSSNGRSNGLVPMLKNFETTANYMDQGGCKRKGKTAVYIEPWHKDFEQVIEMKLKETPASHGAPDLLFGVWAPDLFMKRVQSRQEWSFFCPTDAPQLVFTTDEEFEKAYLHYETTLPKEKIVKKPAWEVFLHILGISHKEGVPYFMFKDSCNKYNNLLHVGNVTGSNLCTEITIPTTPDETAVCVLGSISLHKFIFPGTQEVDFQEILNTASLLVEFLDRTIDTTSYPTLESRNSQLRHRNIGIGINGLGTLFQMLMLPYESYPAQLLNYRISECISKGATDMSIELAKRCGPHPSYAGSLRSQGFLCHDTRPKPDVLDDPSVFNQETLFCPYNIDGSPKTFLDWDITRSNLALYGIRNGTLLAPMPTASTSFLTDGSPSTEPVHSNAYTTHTVAGTGIFINTLLVNQMNTSVVKWTPAIAESIAQNGGSIQHLNVSSNIKAVFKTVWECKTKTAMAMAQARGIFIDQAQSFNLFLDDPSKHASAIFLAWKLGLITGQYYMYTSQLAGNMKMSMHKNTECSSEYLGKRKRSQTLYTTSITAEQTNNIQQEDTSQKNVCSITTELLQERECIMCQ